MVTTNSNVPCPCIECICVPICTNKEYNQIFKDCLLLPIYEPNYNKPMHRDEHKMLEIERHLKPSNWRFKKYDICIVAYNN